MRRWIIVTLLFALAHIGCEFEFDTRGHKVGDGKDSVSSIGLTGGYEIIDSMSPLSRKEQVKLMGECVEDAIAVRHWWEKKVYELSNTLLTKENEHGISQVPHYSPEIAVAFFNYRTR